MWKYFVPIVWLVWFIFFVGFDAYIYYSFGRHHSIVPFAICIGATVIVGYFACLAIYETFKHRNDKDPW